MYSCREGKRDGKQVFFASVFVTIALKKILKLCAKTKIFPPATEYSYYNLAFWRRNYFFNFSTPVYKM
jgi:hypothetical protein